MFLRRRSVQVGRLGGRRRSLLRPASDALGLGLRAARVRNIVRAMTTLRLFATVGLLAASGCAIVASPPREPGQVVLHAAFDPDRSFEGDMVANSDDELILTASASARDDYAPAYSLAIAYRCVATEKPGQRRCGYTARMLRTGSTAEARRSRSLELVAQARTAESASTMRNTLDETPLQWLEADVEACPNGIFAMDSVRVADWRPDIHYALQAVQDREIILHPASIRVRMSGSYTTSTYEGWVLAPGVPAAVRELTDTLEPCWKPATSPRPWNRR